MELADCKIVRGNDFAFIGLTNLFQQLFFTTCLAASFHALDRSLDSPDDRGSTIFPTIRTTTMAMSAKIAAINRRFGPTVVGDGATGPAADATPPPHCGQLNGFGHSVPAVCAGPAHNTESRYFLSTLRLINDFQRLCFSMP